MFTYWWLARQSLLCGRIGAVERIFFFNVIIGLSKLFLNTFMKKIFILCLAIMGFNLAFAQLPNIEVVTANSRNIISWVNQYDKLEKINIQRSADSSKGYVTIGTLSKPKKGNNVYADASPLAGKNYYRVEIYFSEEMNWMSNKKGVYIDSAVLASSKNITDAQAINAAANKVRSENPNIALENVQPSFVFQPSAHVYTNPLTGHINVYLENTIGKRYSLTFFYPDKKEAFKIDRVAIDHLIIDKHNFNGKGTFGFVLYDAGVEVEKGFVNVL
jgi:hypothetical protein